MQNEPISSNGTLLIKVPRFQKFWSHRLEPIVSLQRKYDLDEHDNSLKPETCETELSSKRSPPNPLQPRNLLQSRNPEKTKPPSPVIAKTTKSRNHEIQKCRNVEITKCQKSENPKTRNSEIRNPVIQKSRISEIPKLRNREFTKSRIPEIIKSPNS